MREGSSDRDAENSSGKHVRRCLASADICRPCGLRGNKRLEIDDVQHRGFQQLGLDQRAFYPRKRFVGKNRGAFGHGIHVAKQGSAGEIFEKRLIEERFFVIASKRGK